MILTRNCARNIVPMSTTRSDRCSRISSSILNGTINKWHYYCLLSPFSFAGWLQCKSIFIDVEKVSSQTWAGLSGWMTTPELPPVAAFQKHISTWAAFLTSPLGGGVTACWLLLLRILYRPAQFTSSITELDSCLWLWIYWSPNLYCLFTNDNFIGHVKYLRYNQFSRILILLHAHIVMR